jgi:hypothetical protein
MDVRSDCMTVTLLEPYKFPGRIQDKPGVIAAICSFIFDFPREGADEVSRPHANIV